MATDLLITLAGVPDLPSAQCVSKAVGHFHGTALLCNMLFLQSNTPHDGKGIIVSMDVMG